MLDGYLREGCGNGWGLLIIGDGKIYGLSTGVFRLEWIFVCICYGWIAYLGGVRFGIVSRCCIN